VAAFKNDGTDTDSLTTVQGTVYDNGMKRLPTAPVVDRHETMEATTTKAFRPFFIHADGNYQPAAQSVRQNY
jgi:hypothetical protein